MAVIDCTPTNLHDGKTLGRSVKRAQRHQDRWAHTSGNVALINSKGGEDKGDGLKGLIRTSSIVITSGKIQVHILAIIRATVVPPRDPVGSGQLSASLGFIEE